MSMLKRFSLDTQESTFFKMLCAVFYIIEMTFTEQVDASD